MAAMASLDDHQRFVLMKFKRTVSDITQPHHDDTFLLRWLRARSWNPEAAEKMLRQSMTWRQQMEVDGALKAWHPPENFVRYFPYGVTGYDKEGSIVIVVEFGGLDMVGLLHAFGREVFVRATIQTLEKCLNLSAQKGNYKIVVLFNMENFTLKQYAWRPAGEVIVSLIQMYEANYPEILKVCYIINAPKVFTIAFNLIKRFLNEYTLGKMHIFNSDAKKWQNAVLQNVEPESLPAAYGGTLTDPDGNPKYTSVVMQGGKVPKQLYKKYYPKDGETEKKQYVTTVVKKGDKLCLDFLIAEEGTLLRWDFRTEDHDIRFGVTMKDADGKTTPIIRHKRVATHQIGETGVVSCQAPATYIVTFDNSYSMLRSKKLTYDIEVVPPLGAEEATSKE